MMPSGEDMTSGTDRLKLIGQTHPATKIAVGAYAVSMVVPVALIVSGAWAPIAAQLPGVGS